MDATNPVPDVLGVVRTIADLVGMFRSRISNLGISYETADAISGLPAGYTSKLLGPAGKKRFGPVAIEALLGATGIMFEVVEDPEAMARVRARLVKRRKLVKRAMNPKFSRHLTSEFMRQIGHLGGLKAAERRHTTRIRKQVVSA